MVSEEKLYHPSQIQ